MAYINQKQIKDTTYYYAEEREWRGCVNYSNMSEKRKLVIFFIISVIILLTGALVFAGDQAIDVSWESVGIGGGGGIFNPSISPHIPGLIFLSCDMGGFYRSSDGARTFRMIDGYTVRKVNYPAVFHPYDPNIIYVSALGGIKRSLDQGKTWLPAVGEFNPACPDSPTAMAIDPVRSGVIWAHFQTYLGQKGHFLVRSMDAGKSWQIHPGWPYRDQSIDKILFDPTSLTGHPRVFMLAGGEPYRSDNDGATWEIKNKNLPAGDSHRDLAAALDSKTNTLVIYITRPSQMVEDRFQGGVYKSADGGESWQQVISGLETRSCQSKFQQYERLALSPKNPQIVYVSSSGPGKESSFHPGVWRTEDGGNSWKPVLFGDPSWENCNVTAEWLTLEFGWWWGGFADGLACNPADPNEVIFTDHGRAIRTTNGGGQWLPISSRRINETGRKTNSDGEKMNSDAESWKGYGLEVSTCYNYYFDPHDSRRAYITYTDFGMTRSIDQGDSWIWAGRGSPWTNTCYELALDSDRPGVAFGAWSQAHDLPHWKMLFEGRENISRYGGGLTKSIDSCKNWTPLGKGQLPDAPAVAMVIDPGSPAESRTIYAGFLNQGVYKSIDDGKSWEKKNRGLESTDNMNIWRLDLHKDGTLLCAKTIAYVNEKPVPGGLYRSTDGAENWEKINTNQPLDYIFGARMDPRDSHIIYVACFDVPPQGFFAYGTEMPWPTSRGGGVFKTTDGGSRWEKILNEPWCWDVTFDPADPDIVYAGTFYNGVYRSIDAGKSWQSLKGLPFVCTHRVSVAPDDSKNIYVTTFGGGVWKGRLP